MVLGVIGKKLGMTQIFDENGLVVPVTIVQVDPLTVTQVKTTDNEGYEAVQVGTIETKKRRLSRPEAKHLEKNSLPAFKLLKEFRVKNINDYSVGQKIDLSIFSDVEKVDVTGKSIGKGFQGCIKRHNAHRGPMSHGSKSHRITGSIGAGTTPSRVYKGHKMPGHMGAESVTVRKLKVVKIDNENNLMMIKGSVPGHDGALVTIKPTTTKWNDRSN
ncbi:MAG: 50S ribosomal protein L3 [Vampirovibrionia bacterium]